MREEQRGGVPRAMRALLTLALPRKDRAYALADLEEEFEERVRRDGVGPARRWYRGQALRSLRPLLRGRLAGAVAGGRRMTTEGGRPATGGGWGMGMQNFVNSLAYALRTLAKAPMTVLITVLSLGLGIGAVTTVFAVADGLFHPPAPGLREPERLVTVYTSEEDGERYGVSSYPDYEDVLRAAAVEDAAASTVKRVSLEKDGEVEPLLGEIVTGNYFSVTGLQPVLGRAFSAEEGRPGSGSAVAILGYDLWKERFGGDPSIVGRSIRVNGHPVTIIGVTPEGVVSRRVPVRPDVWLPFGAEQVIGHRSGPDDRNSREYVILARLADGAELPELQAQLSVLGTRLAGEYPDAWKDDRGQDRAFTAVAERDSRVNPRARGILAVVAGFFFAATGLVLLIACTNVTSLFLVRAARRRREVAVRLALGAGRRQIFVLLLAEGLLLGLVAGAVGLLFSEIAAGAMASFSLPINVPLRLDFHPSGRAYAFGFVTALATSLVFSLVPAAKVSRPDLVTALKSGPGSAQGSGRRFRSGSALVSVQFAASLVLIVGAGLFFRSLRKAATLDLGLDPSGVAVMSKEVPEDVGPDGIVAFYHDLESRLTGIPGARAALSRSLEMTLLQLSTGVSARTSLADQPAEGMAAYRNAVTPGYLAMLEVPLLRGRGIREGDGPGAPRVAVVNEAFARAAWPGEDPLGQLVTLTDRSPGPRPREAGALTFQVVGVAADGTYLDVGDPPTPYVWTSLYQDPARTIAVSLKGANAEAMVRELRSRVELAPGEVPLMSPTTYESQLSLQLIHLRLASRVLGWGGGFGLFLALIGVYGLVSFTVAERTREIAIRRAVGADAGRVVGGVVRQGLILAGAGLALGLAVLLPAARLVRGVLVGVGPADPISVLGGVVILLGTAALATLVPAGRAARIDPMTSLRQE